MIVDYDDDWVMVFSKNLMDVESGLFYEEFLLNSFFFNLFYGYCQECKGLGVVNWVDDDKVVFDVSKSINEVGIVFFGEVCDNMIFKQL